MHYDKTQGLWYPNGTFTPYFTVTDSELKSIIRMYLYSHPDNSDNESIAAILNNSPDIVYSLYKLL